MQSQKDVDNITAFVIPGVFGAEPDLLNLCGKLKRRLRLTIVELPDIGAPGDVLSDMVGTARILASDIDRQQPDDLIGIIGYSFGASITLEVVQQLKALGRSISFLGIIDGPLVLQDLQGFFLALRHATPRQIVETILPRVPRKAREMIALSSAMSRENVGLNHTDSTRRGVLMHLRRKALKNWRPIGTSSRGLLISSDQFGPDNTKRWLTLCPNLRHVKMDVQHPDLLRGNSLDRIAMELVRTAHQSFDDAPEDRATT